MAENYSEIPLIVLLASDSVLPHDHFTIRNFFLASFMIQITSIVKKIRKVRSKILKYPVHVIMLRMPALIISKKTEQLYYLYLYKPEYSDYYKAPAYFRANIIYLYTHNYQISMPCVTLLYCNTLHKKIHLYAQVHKIPPRKSAI